MLKTKERGDIATGHAIQYYLSHGYEVCLPIGDKRSYDLVIEKDGLLYKVQVKYAGLYKTKNKCCVGLRITGGNQSHYSAKKYAATDFDLLFVYTERGDRYSIPWAKVIARSEITIEHSKYDEFKIIL